MATPPTYTLAQAPTFDMGLVLSGTNATTTQNTGDIYADNFKGVTVIFDLTANTTGSLALIVEGKDSASGKYFTILGGDTVTNKLSTVGTYVYTIYPGITATAPAANKSASAAGILPAVFRIRVAVADSTPTTYTVGAVLTT